MQEKIVKAQEEEIKEIKQQIKQHLRDADYKVASEKVLEFLR